MRRFIMRSFLIGLAVALFLVACPPPAKPPAKPPAPEAVRYRLPGNMAVIHVDPAFTEDERAAIREAATNWAILSGGRANLRTVEDLTEDTLGEVHSLVKTTSMDPFVWRLDSQFGGVHVLAVTFLSRNGEGPRVIAIITDRIRPSELAWVVTHEMGHFLGLEDLDTSGDVMSGVGSFPGKWFTQADVKECQLVGVCPP